MTQRISHVAIVFVILMGAIVLLGWHFDIEWLKTGIPGGSITMKPNAALCFLLSGVSLALVQRKRLPLLWERVAQIAAGLTIAIGVLTLLQYIFGWNFGIDQLLFPEIAASATTPYPGRMGASAALNFTLVGTALLLLLHKQPGSDRHAQILSAIVAFIALLPLAGHLFGARLFYELIVPTTSMAFHAAITFILLSMGILFARPHQGLMQTILSPLAGGAIAQRLLPGAIVVPLALTWAIFEGHKLEWYDQPTAYAYLSAIQVLIFSTGIYWNARSLNRMERDRYESQRRFQYAIMNSPVPIMLHANNGDVLQINSTWSKITGYHLSDIPTIYHWTTKAYAERKELVTDTLQKLYSLEEGKVLEKELTIRTKTGESRVWYFYAVTLGKTPDGRTIAMTTAIDITERKQAELALVELNQTLENRVAQRTAQLQWANAKLQEELQQRQKAERKLQDSQALLKGIIESATDNIAALDLDYRYLAFNQANRKEMQKIFGIGIEIGRSLKEALAHLPQERDNLIELWERALSGEQFTVTQELGDANLNRNYYELSYGPIRDAYGQIVGASVVGKDVSDRIKAERALRESEARFQAFMNHSPALAWITDRDANIFYCNKNLANLFRQSVEELTGKTPFDIHPRELAEEHIANNRIVIDRGEVVETLESAVRSDGSLGDFLVYKFPIETELGDRLVGGVGLDITERKRAEIARLESEAKLQAILENAPAAIYLKDRQGRFLLVNRACLEFLQLTPEQCLGKTLEELLPGEFSEQVTQNEQQTWQSGIPCKFEEQISLDDGIHTFYNIQFILQDMTGNPYAICGMATDITNLKRAEAALVEAKEVAVAANVAKSAFLANMSHELRTPLNAILGFSQVLARDPNLNEQQQEQIAIINSSGEHLLNLINDVLEISKIEAGRMALHPSSFDFYALIESLEAMLKFKAESKGLQLICDRDSVPRYITTDESKLRQVLTNLVGNAIKFTREGGVSLRVRAEALDALDSEEPPQWSFYFEIEDTGSGIAEEDLQRLFMPFSQTETGRNSSEGTGLGLTISRKFVQMMGGDIQLSSRLDMGTLVKFTIQVTIARESDLKTEPKLRQAIALEPNQPTYRILVVDDRMESRRLMRHFLEPLGFAVREAENGKQGLEIWENWEPHLIWMDMRMPVMDGYEATRQIKSHLKGQATVVIALTASAFEENRTLILSAGCDDFLRKPCREALVLEKLAKYLGVRYRYEESVIGTEATDNLLNAATALHPSALQVMPAEWIAALHHHALAADSTAIEQLLEQIPQESAAIAHLLRDWIDNFRFDKITALTEELVDE